MADGTWYFLITSLLIALFSLAFSLVMTNTFLRKRTMGSSYMMIAFTMIALGEICNTISFWIGGFIPSNKIATGSFQALYINLISLSIIYFYYFSTRHILRDNELVRSLVVILLAETTAVVTTTMFTTILGGHMNFYVTEEFTLANTQIPIIAPSYILLLALFVPLAIFILLRMSINLGSIRRRISDPVGKRGTLFINLSVISLTLNTIAFMGMQIPAVNDHAILVMAIQGLKVIFTFTTLIFGYLGWVLPDWLKKRIRGKAWIVQATKKQSGKHLSIAFSSSEDAKVEQIGIQEVSEP